MNHRWNKTFKTFLHMTGLQLGLLVASQAIAATPIFSLEAQNKFPGTGQAEPVIVSPGESLYGTYKVTLSPKWPQKAQVTLKNLPAGMTVDAQSGCGANSVLNPGENCVLKLLYTVPSVLQEVAITEGPEVCTSSSAIHCSKPNQANQFNMKIGFKPIPNRLLKGNLGLLLGSDTNNLNDWYVINQNTSYSSIKYGNGRYVISVTGPDETGHAYLLTSSDGMSWNKVVLAQNDILSSVYFNDSLNQWLVLAYNGVIYFSNDGVNFKRVQLSTTFPVVGASYAKPVNANPGYWILIASDTTNYNGGKLYTSTNGVDWIERISVSKPTTLNDFAINPDGRVVVINRGYYYGSSVNLYTSSNGIDWTPNTYTYPAGVQYGFDSIMWNDLNNTWLVVGRKFNTATQAYRSLGLKSTNVEGTQYTPIADLTDVNSDPGLYNFGSVGNGSHITVAASKGYIFYSTDGNTWTKQLVGTGFSLSGFKYGQVNGTSSLVLYNQRNQLWSAPLSNLSSWQQINGFNIDKSQSSLLNVNGTSNWYSVGADSTLLRSGDGLTWIIESRRDKSSLIPSVANIFRGNVLNQWFLLASVGLNSGISYSADGILWQLAKLSSSVVYGDSLSALSYSEQQGKYLAVGADSKATPYVKPLVLSSTDGINWNKIIITFAQNNTASAAKILWIKKLSKWVMVGGRALVSSDDGVTWTRQTPTNFIDLPLTGIDWSEDLGQLIAVGASDYSTTKGYIYRSTDALNWTGVERSDTTLLRAVAWSPDVKLWVIVGLGGKILTSPDGITWTSESWASDQNNWDLWNVYWDTSLKLWVAVGGNASSQFLGNILIYSADGKTWTRSTNQQPYLTSTYAAKE